MLARAKVFAFACIDPRFRRALEIFIEKKFNLQPTEYDIKTDAGGINELCKGGPVSEWLIDNAALAQHKHGTKIFVLCNHMDCSYYKGVCGPMDRERETMVHTQNLTKAAFLLKTRLGDIIVLQYIVSYEENPKPKFIFQQVV